MATETKTCQNCTADFQITPDDFLFYEKMKVPPPTWCSYCRFIRKMTFVNERSLYKRPCSSCGTSTITMYHPDRIFPVFCVKCYLSDSWEGTEYGKTYDFSKTFFDQFKELSDNVPHRSLDQNEKNGTGSEYSNFCYSSKDAYLSFNVTGSENIKYCKYIFKRNKNCMDSLIIHENDKGYELAQARRNYNCSFLVESDQCIESSFLYDCFNCVNCCLSSNIRNKSYVFQNRQLSKEEYTKAVSELGLETYSGQMRAKELFTEISGSAIHKYAHIKNSVDVMGDFVENSKNIQYSYGLIDAENLKYVFFSMNTAKDTYDSIFTGRGEQCYEAAYGGRGVNNVAFTFSCGSGSKNLRYCDNCKDCSDCFGCIGLKKKQYCILNTQYSKEDYFELVEKIERHMNEMPYTDKRGKLHPFGEYFPTDLSPFAYNETVAFEEQPLTKEEIISAGYSWRDPETKTHTPTVSSGELPDSIKEIPDTICSEIIKCPNEGNPLTQCTFAYRILPDELSFYRQMNLPIPRYCPNCRYYQRLVWRNKFKFHIRQCNCKTNNHGHEMLCQNRFETMYEPDRKEKIYCESCYQKEVI